MIVLGDIACPTEELNRHLVDVFSENDIFKNKNIICNLEGLVHDNFIASAEKPILYNHSAVIGTLSKVGVKAVSLANNHTLDLPDQFDQTVGLLDENKINYNGAGKSCNDAAHSIIFFDNNIEIVMISACWDFLLYHQNNPEKGIFINTIDEIEILSRIKQTRNEKKRAKILIYLHWSFDLEILPFPMYRQWAEAMIDAGADFIIGCHSHCVQGGEKYKEGYIVYGLGNFYIPNNYFANGKLCFPDFARMQMAFEFDPISNFAFCHWFRYNEDHSIAYLSTQKFEESIELNNYSPYQNMSPTQYVDYYKLNRRKRKFIPVYKDYKNKRINKIFTKYLNGRAKFARFLAERKIINWQN